MNNRYEEAKQIYAKYGVDTDAAMAELQTIPVSLHCWQGDDVTGFDHDGRSPAAFRRRATIPEKRAIPRS